MEVIYSGSISEASKRLYIAQSTISAAIQNIEFEFGFPVFVRKSHGVVLTERGHGLQRGQRFHDVRGRRHHRGGISRLFGAGIADGQCERYADRRHGYLYGYIYQPSAYHEAVSLAVPADREAHGKGGQIKRNQVLCQNGLEVYHHHALCHYGNLYFLRFNH